MLMPATLAIGLSQDIVGDFTRSPTEHIIVQLERPLVVRSVRGTVSWKDSGGVAGGIPRALFEIQGPGANKQIRRAMTDQDGHFRIRHVPLGTYRFKATFHGFQSVMGEIIVRKGAPRASDIQIGMPPGV